MTEEEWETCGVLFTLAAMLETPVASRQTAVLDRKKTLYGCACCRQIWDLLKYEESRAAVDSAEEFADGHISAGQLRQAAQASVTRFRNIYQTPAEYAAYYVASVPAAGYAAAGFVQLAVTRKRRENLEQVQTRLLRDIFGNPFRPVAFSPSWRTSPAIGVAQQMYDSRDFAAMPILADVLQDAGCEDDAILAHCRVENGIHVRGCWVVDLVLGKS